jgi:hypothetical protein
MVIFMKKINKSNKYYTILKLTKHFKKFFQENWDHQQITDDNKLKLLDYFPTKKEIENTETSIYAHLAKKTYELIQKESKINEQEAYFLETTNVLTYTNKEKTEYELNLDFANAEVSDLEHNVKKYLKNKWNAFDIKTKKLGTDLVNKYLKDNSIEIKEEINENFEDSFYNILSEAIKPKLDELIKNIPELKNITRNNENIFKTKYETFLVNSGILIEKESRYELKL